MPPPIFLEVPFKFWLYFTNLLLAPLAMQLMLVVLADAAEGWLILLSLDTVVKLLSVGGQS